MDLESLMALRRHPNAGLYVALTQRCPLHCAHCSTNSTPHAPYAPSADALAAFFASMTATDHPEVVLFTGGEPLLRAALLRRLAGQARAVGARVYVITGGYWVARPPRAVQDALEAVDILTFSYDRFHAPEVPRPALFDAIAEARRRGISVAIQTVRDPAAPEFTDEFLADVGARFDGDVPVFVSGLSPYGRAHELGRGSVDDSGHDCPCLVASWPVIAYTGWIVACCQHEVVDSISPPRHLVLGRLGANSYPEIAAANLSRASLRAVRSLGPAVFCSGGAPTGAYCAPCLAHQPEDEARVKQAFTAAQGPALERLLRLPLFAPMSSILRPRLA
jgi:pyruvate-formate lyase-activating enzyme